MRGGEAERRIGGRRNYVGQGVGRYRLGGREVFHIGHPHGDAGRIGALLEYVCGPDPDEQRLFSAWIEASVRSRLTDHWPWVAAVAAALVAYETLTRAEVLALDPRREAQ